MIDDYAEYKAIANMTDAQAADVLEKVHGLIINCGRMNGKTRLQMVYPMALKKAITALRSTAYIMATAAGAGYEVGRRSMKTDWIKVKDQLPVVPEGKSLVDVLVVAKVHFVPDHVDQRDWTYVVEKATYEPKYGFYGNNIRNYNVKEWMYAPEMPKRYARYILKGEDDD